jgi:hypothetical protein
LSVSVTSSNLAVIPLPTINYPVTAPFPRTGSLVFAPVPYTSTLPGQPVTITVFVKDNGGTSNGGMDTIQQSFTVAVQAVNQPPRIAPVVDPVSKTNTFTVLENAPATTVNLSGIDAGQGDLVLNQTLTVKATSSNTSLIPDPVINYMSPNGTGTLTFTPVPFTSTPAGQPVTITVFVMDNGGTAFGGMDSVQETFSVVVLPVNQPPTLDPIPNPGTLLQNAPLQTVSLTGISAGQGDSTQTVSVNAAVTGGTAGSTLIPAANLGVQYNGGSTATLTFTPAAGVSGTAIITVTVMDNGGVSNNGVDTVTQQFTVTVLKVNQAPTLDQPSNPAPILENITTTPQTFTVPLTGISDGDTGTQTLSFSAVSSNPGLIPNPTIKYPATDPTTATLSFTPTPGVSSPQPVVITVSVKDNGGTANGGIDTVTKSFSVTILPVNSAPSINPIADQSTVENAPQQTINLSGIVNGTGNAAGQTLSVTATSSNTALIPNSGTGALTVQYTSPATTGSLTYTPVPGQSGTATITVVVSNGGTTTNGGANSTIETFTITVQGINQAPTLNAITVNPTVLENSTTPTNVALTGISDGDNGTQILTISAASSNALLIANPIAVNYTNPNSSGSLSFTPVHNAVGTATITVTVMDNGGVAFGGHDTVTRTFTVTIQPVNQQPSFTAINPPAVGENSGPQTLLNFALFNPGGGPNELNQTATYIVTSLTNPGLFDVDPAISPTGTLTYTPAPQTAGTATFTVQVMDNGGTAFGGINLSAPQTFTITVNSVNVAPSFVRGPNETVPENAPAQTLTGWATSISPGPANESNQIVNFIVSNNNNALFAAQPAIAPDGTLTYTPAPGTSGTATVTVSLHDNGGVANGGVDTSAPQMFTITVSPIAAPPVVVPMAPVSFTQGGTAGSVVVAMFSEANGGPASDFSATINWGDGTPPTAGTVILDSVATATSPATYSVLGNHVYTASGAFTISVSIVNHNGGSSVNATNVAVATSTSGFLNAQLSAASDSGPSNSDRVTNVTNPTITGTTLPGAQLTLVAQSSSGTLTSVATGTADSSGNFQLTSSALPDGTYNFMVTSTPSTPLAPTANVTVGPVVIDTVSPRIASVTLLPKTGQILITYTDVGDGLNLTSLTNKLSYLLVGKVTNVTAISSPSGSLNQETVALTLNGGKKIKSGSIVLALDAKGVNVIDQAGNSLAGTFISTPPGGNGVPTGPLSLKFTVKNGKVVVPKIKKAGLQVKSLSLPSGPVHHGRH